MQSAPPPRKNDRARASLRSLGSTSARPHPPRGAVQSHRFPLQDVSGSADSVRLWSFVFLLHQARPPSGAPRARLVKKTTGLRPYFFNSACGGACWCTRWRARSPGPRHLPLPRRSRPLQKKSLSSQKPQRRSELLRPIVIMIRVRRPHSRIQQLPPPRFAFP